MRDKENKKRKDQPSERKIGNEKPLGKPRVPGSGLVGEHDLGNTAEREIDRNVHTKNSVSGSETDGQAE